MTDPELIVSLKAERNRLKWLNERLWHTCIALVVVALLFSLTLFVVLVLPA